MNTSVADESQSSSVESTIKRETAPGAPQTMRIARSLLGWLSPNEAQQLFCTGKQAGSQPSGAQLTLYSLATQAVQARQAINDDTCTVLPLPDELSGYVSSMQGDMACQQHLNDGWEPKLIDLRAVRGFQQNVCIGDDDQRTGSARDGDWGSIIRVTLPTVHAAFMGIADNPQNNGWLFTSRNPNLRVLQRVSCLAPVGPGGQNVQVFGYVIGVLPSFVKVMQFGKKNVLMDGYHRAVALLKRGINIAPVFVRRHRDGEMGIPFGPGFLNPDITLGDQAPLLKDYWNDTVSADVELTHMTKTVVIQGMEVLIPQTDCI